MIFQYNATVKEDWIDYNGHMRDAYYGLVFSLAVDSFQDEVGFDAAYRTRTGCTIYVIEDHKVYLNEVHQGDDLLVETRVLDVDPKRFHLYMVMLRAGDPVCIGEFMELHVQQRPMPRAVSMPEHIMQKLLKVKVAEKDVAILQHRSRLLKIKRQ